MGTIEQHSAALFDQYASLLKCTAKTGKSAKLCLSDCCFDFYTSFVTIIELPDS